MIGLKRDIVIKIIKGIAEHRSLDEIRIKLGFSKTVFQSILDQLVSEGYIEMVECKVSPMCRACASGCFSREIGVKMYRLTDKALDTLDNAS